MSLSSTPSKKPKLDPPTSRSTPSPSQDQESVFLSSSAHSSSSLVLEALSSLPLDVFRSLLSSYVLPSLESLSESQHETLRRAFNAALDSQHSRQDLLDRLAFDKHEKSLTRLSAKAREGRQQKSRSSHFPSSLQAPNQIPFLTWSVPTVRTGITGL